MAITYKITEADADKGVVTVDVDFGDKSPVYTKRMMAPVADGADAVTACVEGWLVDLGEDRPAATLPKPTTPDDVTKLIGQAQTFEAAPIG